MFIVTPRGASPTCRHVHSYIKQEEDHLQGVHKKSLRYVWKAIEPLRIEVGIKVRGVSESAGAELSWTYHNFSVAHLGPEIFEFKVGPVPEIIFLM